MKLIVHDIEETLLHATKKCFMYIMISKYLIISCIKNLVSIKEIENVRRIEKRNWREINTK